MLGALIFGLQQEILAQFGEDCSILLRTDYRPANMATYKMPLILIAVEASEATMQFMGGLTEEDYMITLSAYNYEPDNSGMDQTGYSANLIDNVLSPLRRVFSNYSTFKSAAMRALNPTYGTRLTLVGMHKAEALEHPDGLILGEAITFDSISFDNKTTGFVEQTPLQTINVVNPPPDH